METQYFQERAELRRLLKDYPEWQTQAYAEALQRSVAWVRKWRKRLAAAPPEDDTVLHSRSRARHHPPEKISAAVVQAVLAIRDNPPQNLHRTPGPVAIRYYLERDQSLQASGARLPRSTRTLWRILREAGRIQAPTAGTHEPWELVEPLSEWQLDFKSVSSVSATHDGKQQHVVEVLNVVDKGTSILLDSLPREDYTAESALLAVTNTLLINGLPRQITFDRDPRLVGSNRGSEGDFPSAFVRFLLCLGIHPDICPPRRPDLNAYVERFHRSYDQECLQIHRPDTLAAVQEVSQAYQYHYNHERPHQGRSCGNRPPYTAFPTLPKRPPLPSHVHLDAWLTHIHQRTYRRHVDARGTVQLGRQAYYIQKNLRGRTVTLQVHSPSQTLQVWLERQVIKTLPIKGLHHSEVEFETFLRLMCAEAVSEYRRYCQQAIRHVVV